MHSNTLCNACALDVSLTESTALRLCAASFQRQSSSDQQPPPFHHCTVASSTRIAAPSTQQLRMECIYGQSICRSWNHWMYTSRGCCVPQLLSTKLLQTNTKTMVTARQACGKNDIVSISLCFDHYCSRSNSRCPIEKVVESEEKYLSACLSEKK